MVSGSAPVRKGLSGWQKAQPARFTGTKLPCESCYGKEQSSPNLILTMEFRLNLLFQFLSLTRPNHSGEVFSSLSANL